MYNLFVESDHYCLYKGKKYEINKLILFIYENQRDSSVVESRKVEVADHRTILTKSCWVLSRDTVDSMKGNAGSYPNSISSKTITPREIIAEPVLYNAEYQKILSADIMFPIVMINNNVIFDGHHRLVKAILFNVPTINAYLIKDIRALDLYFGHISTNKN